MKRYTFSPLIGLCKECADGLEKRLAKKGFCFYHYNLQKPKKRIKQISSKEKVRKDELSKVYEEIDNERERICSGCHGLKGRALSHSHIIPRSECKELEADTENITFHCLENCHPIWESNNINLMKSLDAFEKNMAYIKRVRPNYYNALNKKNE